MSLANSRLGRYHLLRQIGSGGMGTIYLAQDTHMPRQVAVKVVRTDDELQDSSEVAQKMEKLFYREMQAIAQLDHPHILPVFDFGKEKVDEALYTYLVMQYRPEGSLTDWLRQSRNNSALPPSEVASFTWQAAEALQHAHDHGVVHQDVKPPNFLLRAHSSRPGDLPNLLLADFGIARFFTSTASQGLSQSHDVRGTPMFMAPEQWDGRAVPASDQYALAVMAFRMLTGQLPFQGSLGQIMHHHYMVQPPDPSSLNPQLGSAIDEVIKRALAKQSKDRFPSIMEFAQAFAQAQASSGEQPGERALNPSMPAPSQGLISTLLPNIQGPQRAQQTPVPTGEYSLTLSAPNISSAQLNQSSQSINIPGSAANTPTFLPGQTSALNSAPLATPMAQSAQTSAPTASTPTFLPEQMPFPNATNQTATRSAPNEQPGQINDLSAPTSLSTSGPISQAGLSHNYAINTPVFMPTPIPPAAPMSNPGIATLSGPLIGIQAEQNGGAPFSAPPGTSQMPVFYPVEAALFNAPAPALPGFPPNPPANQAMAPRKKLSVLQTGLLLGLVALLVLGGGGTLLFRSISASRNNLHSGGASGQGNIQSGGSLLPGQTPVGSGSGIGIIRTATPTTGQSSTPNPGAGSTPGATSTPGIKPTSTPVAPGVTPTAVPPKPTPVPPTATPKPTPHPCVTDTWTSHLRPTFSKGGTAHYVSGYCSGTVYLTLTAAPASGGHEVDFQICYALNSTNCTSWVAYTSPNAWRTMATGLGNNQVFYINTRCNSCTASLTTLSGGVKY